MVVRVAVQTLTFHTTTIQAPHLLHTYAQHRLTIITYVQCDAAGVAAWPGKAYSQARILMYAYSARRTFVQSFTALRQPGESDSKLSYSRRRVHLAVIYLKTQSEYINIILGTSTFAYRKDLRLKFRLLILPTPASWDVTEGDSSRSPEMHPTCALSVLEISNIPGHPLNSPSGFPYVLIISATVFWRIEILKIRRFFSS